MGCYALRISRRESTRSITYGSPPISPSGFGGIPDSVSAIRLAWEDSDNESGYSLQRALDEVGAWSLVHSVDADETNFLDSGLDPNTRYCYRLKAFNTLGESAYADVVCSVTDSKQMELEVLAEYWAPVILQGVASKFKKISAQMGLPHQVGLRRQRSRK